MIHKIEQYHDDQGHVVQSRTQVLGDTGEYPEIGIRIPAVTYFAQAVLQFKLPNGAAGQFPFTFDIAGSCIEDAFGNFPIAMRAGEEKAKIDLQHQLEQQSKQIVLPIGQQLPPLGKPKTKHV